MNKFAQAIAIVALTIASFAPMHTVHAFTTIDNGTAKTCPVGYARKNGKCVKIKITGNPKLSKLADCLANHAQTVKEFQACMSK